MFYFRWCDEGDAFAAVVDEDVFSVEVTHAEGEFAVAKVEVRNPRVGLLSAGRFQWAWIGWDDASTASPTPLFFGRLVAIPEQITDELILLQFIARPSDYDAQKEALAATLRVAPFWDPVWVNPEQRDNPDVVLETRPQAWHIDRVSHELTASDILDGEDGTVTLSADDGFYDSLSVSFGQSPLTRIECEATVGWEQAAIGDLDVTEAVADAFALAGSEYGLAGSYTGQGLQEDWPEKGDRIGGGWIVGDTRPIRLDGTRVPTQLFGVECQEMRAGFPLWYIDPYFVARYDVKRQRRETVRFTIDADVQALVATPSTDNLASIRLSSTEISNYIDTDPLASAGLAMPIGDVRRPTFFKTDRGLQAIENLIVLCRARLLARARCITITRDVSFDFATALSCRMNIAMTDPRVPGGAISGKVVSYGFRFGGDGVAIGTVTFACTIGRGGSVTEDPGTPLYVDTGYAADGWQAYSGGATAIASADIAYSSIDDQPLDDDGVDLINLNAGNAVISCTVQNGPAAQRAALNGTTYEDVGAAMAAMNEVYTRVGLELLPLTGGPFLTEFNVTVTDLVIPKTIDLEV